MRKVITSSSNPLIKEVERLKQKKYRNEAKTFVIEGMRAVGEISSEWNIQKLFVEENNQAADELAQEISLKAGEVYEVPVSLLQKMSDTEHPQGILAVVEQKQVALDELVLPSKPVVLVLDGVRDPGNLGTIIRTADAAGIAAVILLEGCVDLFSPKVIRGTMGSIFHLPLVAEVTTETFIQWAKKAKIDILCTNLAENSKSIFAIENPKQGMAIVIGSEAEGVSERLVAESKENIIIPMPGKAESLNAGVAAGIILFECVRRNLVR